MNTAMIIGITVGIVISVGGCVTWWTYPARKNTKKNRAAANEFKIILDRVLSKHNPRIVVAVREAFPEDSLTAWINAHGKWHGISAPRDIMAMVEQAERADEFFRRQKLIRWVEDNPMPPEPPKVEPESAEIIRLAQKVADAYTKPGIAPDYHYRKMAQLRTEWPTLSAAVCNLTGYMKEHN